MSGYPWCTVGSWSVPGEAAMRAMTTLLTSVVTAVLLVGCAQAGSLDGDLTDDWAALPPATAFAPAAGVCQAADFTSTVTLASYQPVDCAGPHRVETVHVGAFPAERAAVPANGSVELRGAFAECDTRAAGYLGEDWRFGRLRLSVALPSGPGWAAGSRWYRCDVSELTAADQAATVVVRSGSLRDALKSASSLRLGCQQAASGRTQTLAAVACESRHNAEFVGVWKAAPDAPYPTKPGDWGWPTTAAAPSSAGTSACPTTACCSTAPAW
ncbi:hypothetical protein GCM10027614_53170 [Micromonospora vulcania]